MKDINECKICGNLSEAGKQFVLKEMMYGLNQDFVYVQCKSCNSLNIAEIPANLSEYYLEDYYSFKIPDVKKDSRLKLFLVRNRTQFILSRKYFFGRVLNFFRKDKDLMLKYLRYAGATFDSQILDVGAGNGAELYNLFKKGFKRIEGIDPLIENDILYNQHLKILKKDISELAGKIYDIIIVNHVIEHVADPRPFLKKCHELLNDKGKLIVRTPMLDSFAWENYKENWVQLDAPRHVTIFTKASIIDFFSRNNFALKKLLYDSYEFQFWGSELYKNKIPLIAKDTHQFSKTKLSLWKNESSKLNDLYKGDQATFIFVKSNS